MSEIAVLLPVRLETRVDQAAVGAPWVLRLRVNPDEASVLRHSASVSSAEWDLVTRFWGAFKGPTAGANPAADWLATPAGAAAWADFAGAVGGPRACWLAASSRPTTFDAAGRPVLTPPPLDQPVPHNRISGFPRSLSVWAVFGGQPPVLLATQPVAADALELRPPDRANPLRPDPDDAARTLGEEEWWSSWDKAKSVGLAIECPLQGTPETLEALYVVGLGAGRPGEHFASRADAGDVAILAAGTPTNTVHGKPAASLDGDPASWLPITLRRLRGTHEAANAQLGLALTGKAGALPAVPGDDNDDAEWGQKLVKALWSPLWGHALRDVWGLLGGAARASEWAAQFLYPEGPLPPVRLNDQPYGLLPTTSLARWKPDPTDPAFTDVEEPMVGLLARMRKHWAAAARAAGNVVGASTERLLDLLGRDGVTARYGSRRFVEDRALAQLYALEPAFNNAAFRSRLEEWVRVVAFRATREVGREPAHFFLGYGGYRRLGVPLVKPVPELPVPLEELVGDLRTLTPNAFHERHPDDPGSLLLRLMVWAAFYNRAALALENDPSLAGILIDGLLVEPPVVNDRTILGSTFPAATSEIDRLVQTVPDPPGNLPAGAILGRMLEGFDFILEAFRDLNKELPRLERVFRATLDSATHRIDPWISGVAWHRLKHLEGDPATRRRLGVYGWVDGPILGTHGPTEGGLLHVPSRGQAIATVVLRDKFLSERQEAPPPARNPWAMNLDSRSIRLAAAIAEEVRVGAHLWEVVGRQVERVVGTVDAVNQLRRLFPVRTDRKDAAIVCQGLDALAALSPGPLPEVPLTQRQKEELADVRAALDAYGDLLVCEAVYQVTHGKGDAAGATMDAAVGLARPPALDFVKTARQGRSLQTCVLCALPHRDPPAAGADTSPGLLADPSVAAALPQILGDAPQWVWETTAPPARLTLVDLGLTPIDALALGPETIVAAVRAIVSAPLVRQLEPPGVGEAQAADLRASIAAVYQRAVEGTGDDKHRQARHLIQAIGRHPCLWRDLATVGPSDPSAAEVAARDGLIRADFQARYDALKGAAAALQSALTNAADDSDRRQALRAAVRWGIVPSLADAPPAAVLRVIFAADPPAADLALLPKAADAAAAALAARLKVATTPPNDTPANAAQVAAALAELASPGGILAVLSPMERAELGARIGRPLDRDAALDAEWLNVVAAVRPPMARFEAWQLEGGTLGGFTPLAARANDDDPWMKAALKANEQAAEAVKGIRFPRFVAAYGTAATWDPATTKFAVALIDAWGETAPTRAHVTTAAFGFNAPASRAPQAILLAAPPDATQPFDEETLRDVVIETRELAHARAARLDQLGDLQALAPLAMLPGTGSSAFRATR